MQLTVEGRQAKFGLAGFFLSVASMLVILIQLSAFFEPQTKSVGSVIGEIAADIKLTAKRALAGEPAPKPIPDPNPPAQDYAALITIISLVAAGIAVVLGGIGLYRNEPHRLPNMAIGVGIAVFVMQYVFWLALLVCGVALLISIIGNLDSIFG